MKLLLAAALLGLAHIVSSAAEVIDLSGVWHVSLDRKDSGRDERWFARACEQPIQLPGSLQQARLGDPITMETRWTGGVFDKSWFTAPGYEVYRQPGNIKVPFWLQPETHYTGAAWYQRTIEIPAAWTGRRVTLCLERPHWTTTVWLGGREIGSSDANSTAHIYELGSDLPPGCHTLTIRVDNRLVPDIGENSHSISDHTQGNWNGIVGRIELAAHEPVWIDQFDVETRIADRSALVRGRLGRIASQPWPAAVELAARGLSPVKAPVADDGSFAAEYPFSPNAPLWDEFAPALHELTATLPNGERQTMRFGFRQFSAQGRQLMINGRKLFLRGALDCAIFPKTGHPPTDCASWLKEFRVIKDHGLNHVRFHSWCPPEAAFQAADELGLYLQIEAASWPNWSTTLGDGKPVDAWIEAESRRILKAYGNHPSFAFLCAGNEPQGDRYPAWLAGWTERRKRADPRRLYTAGAGRPEIPENDFHVAPKPRIQHGDEGLASRINARAPETRSDYADYIGARTAPVVAHEIGQWCAYPNFAEMAKYTGYLKPRNFEIFHASLSAHGMAHQAREFLLASGKLQALCYKEDIESALRTSAMGGFQLLGLQDFPGQGTALVGVLDSFWDEKGYINAAEFRRFCNSTVPLARLDKRVFTTDEHLTADIEIAHFGAADLADAEVRWKLVGDDGKAVRQGVFPRSTIAIGNGAKLGHIHEPLANIPSPARYRLVVEIAGTDFANDWDVWVYPAADKVVSAPAASVTVVSGWDANTRAILEAGGTVWLMADGKQVRLDPEKGAIAFGFSSIFWNTAWTNGQPPHTFGVLCDPKHPAFTSFPTDFHSNWQWWYPIKEAVPMILDELPRELRPIVQIVDDWVTNRKLGLVFEARVGSGRLLVSSINLRDPVLDPVRRQLRASLLAYVSSVNFNPAVTVTPEALATLFKQ
jgi:hypothetical protein